MEFFYTELKKIEQFEIVKLRILIFNVEKKIKLLIFYTTQNNFKIKKKASLLKSSKNRFRFSLFYILDQIINLKNY